MLATKQSFRPIDGELLDGIDVFTTAIPALLRITFGVLVRQDAALRFHDRTAGEIFRRDQLDVFALPFLFRADRVENFRIGLAQTAQVRGRSARAGWNLVERRP